MGNTKRGRTAIWIGLLAGVAITTLLILGFPYFMSTNSRAAVVRIPAHADHNQLHDTLGKYFGSDYADRVVRLVKTEGTPLQKRHGAYEVPEGTSPMKAARIITHGAQTPLRLTINGVRDLTGFMPRIAAKFDFSADSLLSALQNPELLDKYSITKSQLPVLFLNDSYDFYWNVSPGEVIEKIASNYTGFWTPANRKKADELGLTPSEVAVIASIVDEETNQADEKGRIGRLYVNRLHKGMRLQADPTVRFALGDFTIRRVKGEHLRVDSPYNTYIHPGLPPGPIRTTSKATMQAVLDSEPSDDLYMCASSDFSGHHIFAADYTTHLQNARNYQQALDQRGIH